MKHKRGNTPKCFECVHFRERSGGEKQRGWNDGWCHEARAQGVNGRRPVHPKERTQCYSHDSACRWWRDAESGYTRFEVETGYKEPYDGTKIDFGEDAK